MKILAPALVALALASAPLFAQEPKPVPKDSVRLSIPGCAHGYVFTTGPRTADRPGTADLPDGMHLRMNGPKKLMTAIRLHQASMIEITGIIKKSDLRPGGVGIGGVLIMPGRDEPGGSLSNTMVGGGRTSIDVEGWRQIVGNCPAR